MDFNQAIENMRAVPEEERWVYFQAFVASEMKEHFSQEQLEDIIKAIKIGILIFR